MDYKDQLYDMARRDYRELLKILSGAYQSSHAEEAHEIVRYVEERSSHLEEIFPELTLEFN